MKINPISFQYNFTKPQKKNSNVASNSILMQSKSENITKYPVAFGSLIQFLDLKNAGYNVANVENNRLSNNEDKILINSAESFLALANSPNIWNKKIVLANDIDLNGKEIKPIGSAKAPFRGEFDGNGCKITNFKIDSPEGRNIGLFGKCENAKISNLEIEKAFIRGNEQIGGFAGFASNSELNNCHFQGYISGNKFIGGLIGIGNKNTVKNSSSECNIIAEEENNFSPFDIETDVNKTESIGGFIGSDYESTINSSYSKSKINGDEQVGGFIGYAKNSEINNCAFDGIINADAKSGSMIGWGENSVINTSYSLSNQKKHIGYGLNNSTSGVCNDIDDLMSGYGCWNSDIWIKDYDKIPRLRIQEDRMSTQKLFFDDVNKDIDAERITDPFDELDAENVLEDIQLNIFPPKHFPSNDELLNKIRNCNDPEVLFESFNNFILNDRYITRPSMEIKDEYKEILLEFVKNPKMDLNRRSEYGYSIWCTPLFIMTTINENNDITCKLAKSIF